MVGIGSLCRSRFVLPISGEGGADNGEVVVMFGFDSVQVRRGSSSVSQVQLRFSLVSAGLNSVRYRFVKFRVCFG
ncbi:hypothetical protein Hanom_Chr04g00327591 [Helianthus anomalus]